MQVIQRTSLRCRGQAGFSLAELMVVIVILGLLATLVVPNVMKQLLTSNKAIAKADISAISQAITTYQLDHSGKAPERLEDLIAPDENGHAYLDRTTLPKDPWKNEYAYEPPQGMQKFRVICYGSDGQPGGEGDAADIDNVTMLEK